MSQSADHGTTGNASEAYVLSRVAELLGRSDLTCHVVFVSRKKAGGKTDDGRRHNFELASMNLREGAYAEIVRRYKEFAKRGEGWDAISLADNDDGGEPPEQSYYVENVSGVPFYDEHLAEPSGGQKTNLDTKFISTLAAIQFRFKSDAGTAVFIKRITPGKILKHKKRVLFKMVTGDLDIEKNNVVELPEGCDCCVFGDQMLIFTRHAYENLFDHHARYEAAHKEIFALLRKRNDYEIDGIDKLERQTLNDLSKLRRFPAIKNKMIWNKTFSEIQLFLKARQIKGVAVTTNPNRVLFEDSRAIIHFFNDSHLDSKVTGIQYLASAKTEE